MAALQGDAAKAAGELHEAITELRRIKKELPVTSTTNNNNPVVKVEAGGFALWLAAMCCAVSVTFGITTQNQLTREIARKDAEINDMREEISKSNSLLSAIYMQAPYLRPDKDDSERNYRKQTALQGGDGP